VSEPPQKKHPWAKYYNERGAPRPPIGEVAPPPAAKASGDKNASPFRGGARRRSDIRSELAAAVAAVNAGMPGATAAPFITAMQKEALGREQRRRFRRRLALVGVAALAAAVAVHLAVTRFFYRAPSEVALEAFGGGIATSVGSFYSTRLQPLRLERVTIELTDRIDAQHLRYAALVRLALREPLYAPAITNGTAAYRQLQESLHAARARELKLHLFSPADAPPLPELPLLIQVSHRAGESIVVRVPFTAHRFDWRWRIDPARLALRSVDHTLDGDALERFATTPHLIFGAPGTLVEMRQRMRLARDYIIAVAKEAQKHPATETVADAPATADPGAATKPAAIAPEAPARSAEAAEEKTASPTTESLADKPAVDTSSPRIAHPKKTTEPVNPDAPAVAPPDKPAAPPAR